MSTTTTTVHPLAPLSGDEITAACQLIVASDRIVVAPEDVRFAYVGLCDPPKEMVRAVDRGEAVELDRQVRLVLLQGPEADVVEATVSVTRAAIDRWELVHGVRPPLQMEEAIGVLAALWDNPEWNAALDRRGIEDRSLVQIDPWPAGTFGLAHEQNRRITRCLAYLRTSPDDNGYARPLEGLLAFVDMGRGEVLEVVDLGVVPIPPESGSYYLDDNGPARTDLKPLEIIQPEGPSFTVDANLVRWQKWSLRVGMDPLEGLVLHTVGYEDGGRVRPILFRASVSEMVVPYGHPGPMHSWKSAFDAGEWGLGRMANSLTLGCDCLGEIFYFDDVFADERGNARTRLNAICLHEEDYGILWKHVDMVSGHTEVRRSRRLVVSSIATVGNYEYGFYWYFYLDGSMQLEVKLSGIMSTMAVGDAGPGGHANMIAPGLAAPYHQHLFNVRLDVEVDGDANAVFEMDAVPSAPGPDNPWGNAFESKATLLERELAARRTVDPSRSRSWKIVNRSTPNRLGQPTGYKLLPAATPTLLADPTSSVGRRAAFAAHNLWVTPYRPDERRAAGDYPNQHVGGTGLPEWTAQDRDVVDTDIVVWHSFGVTHLPRPEDWPVMPVEYTGFSLIPVGFFDRNPALDVPPRRREAIAMANEPLEYHPPVEEYLETMLGLVEEGVPVIQARIAERLGRSAPSVSEMLDRLIDDGYVTREGRRLDLTESGRHLAEGVVRKHRLAERLLVDVIGLEWHKVHREAGRWEHVISNDVEARLVELLGDPSTCPHGNPIPGSHSPAPTVATRPLGEVEPGERVRLMRISEEVELNFGWLTLLGEGGFIPGAIATIDGRDGDGTVTVRVEGDDRDALAVPSSLTGRLFVGGP